MTRARPRASASLLLALCSSILLALAAPVAGARPAGATDAPLVAAASDLQFALEEIATAFSRDSGETVRLSFGSSGNFARQIRQGAPFQLYLSADEDYVDMLAKGGFTRDEGVLYGIGRIVLMTPHGSPLQADGTLESLAAAVQEGRIRRFSIANPEHAPYGKRAEEALRHQGLWEVVQPLLVLGENVSQAAQFVTSGNAQGGIIAYSLALAPRVAARGSYELIPADWHSPLRQRMVLLGNAGAIAENFYDYLQQPAARRILVRYGFVLPEDTD